MKKIILAIAIALTLVGCSNNNVKSNSAAESGTEAVQAADSNPSGQIVGGFTEYREITEEEMAIFKKAIGESDMEFTPQKVATQVVNGINYKFFCDCKDGYNLQRCEVTIYKPINGEPTVTKMEIK